GPITLLSRAIDDSGNRENPGGSVTVSVADSECPCNSLWNPALAAPTLADAGDAHAVELGVKFTSDVPGFVSGIRFYKATANIGTHIGNLWSASGTQLATAI